MRIEKKSVENSAYPADNSKKTSTTPFIPLSLTKNELTTPYNFKEKKISTVENNPNIEEKKSKNSEFLLTQMFIENLFTGPFVNSNIRKEKSCARDLEAFQQKMDLQFKKIENLNSFKENFSDILKYLHNNQDTFLGFLKNTFFSDEDYAIVDLFLKDGYDAVKLSDHIFALFQKGAEAFLLDQFLKELHEIEKKHNRILNINKNQQFLVKKLNQDLSGRLKSSLKNGGYQLIELLIYKIFPLAVVSIIKTFDNKQFIKIFKQFFRFHKQCAKISDFKVNFSKKNKWVKELKPKINISPKFCDVLNPNTVNNSASNPNFIDQLLKDKKVDFEKKVLKSIEILETLNSEFGQLNFDSFKIVLLKHGFDLNGIEKAPKSTVEWSECFKEFSFKESLGKKNVEKQTTVAKLLQQGMLHALTDKIDIENKFIFFNLIKNVTEIISTVFQILLFIPQCAIHLAKCGIDQLEKNFPIPGIEYAFVINSDLDLSLIGLAYMIITHVFGFYYKPNEYSLKGYWIDFQNKLAHVGYNLQYLLLFIMKSSFQLTDWIIEFCLRIKKSPTSKINAYRNLNEKLTENRDLYGKRLHYLGMQLNILKEKDIKLAFNSKLNLPKNDEIFILRKYLCDNHFPKMLLRKFDVQVKNNQVDFQKIDAFLASRHLLSRKKITKGETIYQFDMIQIMLDTIDKSELSLFPDDVKEFFRKNLNMVLETENPKLIEQMKKFFLTSDKHFFKFFQEDKAEEAIPAFA
jgi:hypothetical protein